MKRFYKNIALIIEVMAIIVLTAIFYFISGNIWIVPFGGLILISVIVHSFFERRRYEEELEQVTEYIDKILLEETIDDETISDNMTSKLNHQLVRLQSMVKAYSENARKDKQEIRDLIVEIAHQLRMPIANIDTYLELLREDDLEAGEREKYMNAIEISKGKLIFLVESFIKMSRLESNVIQIRKKSTDINKTIKNEIDSINDFAIEKGIDISFVNKAGISIPHDSNWLGEAIFNLLDNSVKYSPEKSEIKIEVLKNEMFTEIRIIDEGSPIPTEEENLIFKRFYRGSNVNSEEGFGLGLYLTREIVLKHDGFVKLKNLGDGHSFSVYLPN